MKPRKYDNRRCPHINMMSRLRNTSLVMINSLNSFIFPWLGVTSEKRVGEGQTQMSVCRYKFGCPLKFNRLSSCLKRKQWCCITQS